MAEPSHPSSSSEQSVTQWLEQLHQGDSMAAHQLWQRYLERLMRLAARKLGDLPRFFADEEDVAISAFHDFLRGIEKGRFPQLKDRDDLWQVLVMLTERRAIGLRRQTLAEKRGAGLVCIALPLDAHTASGASAPSIGQLADCEPTPQFAAEMEEELRRLFGLLDDDTLRTIATGKLEGYTNVELAGKLSLSLRAVERKLRLIRRLWSEEPEP